MKDNRSYIRALQAAGIALVVLLTYNIALFGIAHFDGHGASFWISYAFMMIGFFVVMITVALVLGKRFKPKDWLFGYPIFSHCTVYIVVELIASVLFMVLDIFRIPWGIALSVQMLILGVHLVFNISCFIAKATINDISQNTKQKTLFIETLRVEAETLAESARDAEVKAAYQKLAEEFQYSDPVSSPMLLDVEQRLAAAVSKARPLVEAGDRLNALAACHQISLILSERNKKCKLYK